MSPRTAEHVAVKSGSVVIDGICHHVKAGYTRWNLTHEEMQNQNIRVLFGLNGSAPSRTTSRPAAATPRRFPKRERESGREIPDLIRELPRFPFELTVPSLVRDVIAGSLAEFNGPLTIGGTETGGFLIGRIEGRRGYTNHATDAAFNRTRESVSLDSRAIDMARAQLEADGRRADLLGDWHAHSRPGRATPSDRDLAGWLAMRDAEGLWRYIGMILTPHDLWGWTQPTLSAWSVRREGNRFPICEPALVR
jgi:hypothetical protein